MSALVFGEVDPLTLAGGPPLVAVGWHPVCGHVRHLSNGRSIDGPLSSMLMYGLVPKPEARERHAECDVCRVGTETIEQPGLAL